MGEAPKFRSDLYRGTAAFYDRYRVRYPPAMLGDLASRARLSGTGRLLDLACGTGQVTFGMYSRFREVWAIDQEDEAVSFARAKAERTGVANVRWITGRAEDLEVNERFELITIGNAFHRLDRRRVAASALNWLEPGGHIALLWSDTPWTGVAHWQRIMGEVVRHWMCETNAADRVPSNLNDILAADSSLSVLAAAGLQVVGTFEFPARHTWTVDGLTGLMYSTSVLSLAALGNDADAFARDLRERLLALNRDGIFEQEISFTYELATRP